MDFTAHNRRVEAVWRAFHSGHPIRMPMVISANPRVVVCNPAYNKTGVTFRDYYEDPQKMLEMQLLFRRYMRFHVTADHAMGDPGEDGWEVEVSFHNAFECAWLGAPISYVENNLPCVLPLLDEAHKNLLFDRGIPEEAAGIVGQSRAFYAYFQEQKQKGFRYHGSPIGEIRLSGQFSDGPFTLACNLRGAAEFCMDLLDDPDYAEALLDFLTDSIIARIRAQRRFLGLPERAEEHWFADDSIILISNACYRDLVLPRHKRMVEALMAPGGRLGIHLCGNAQRYFKLLADELGASRFETGFPLRHGDLVRELGPGVIVQGGVHIDTLRTGAPDEVARETAHILGEVVPHTRRFIFQEANNLPPLTPDANIRAMYETVCAAGRYEADSP